MALDNFAGDLVGMDDAAGVPRLWRGCAAEQGCEGPAVVGTPTKLDWSELVCTDELRGWISMRRWTQLNATSLGDLTAGVDLAVGGGVALNVLAGVLVAKGSFPMQLGTMTERGADGAAGGSDDVGR